MDLLLNGMERFSWLVSAGCDLLALSAVIGVARIMVPATPNLSPRSARDRTTPPEPANRIFSAPNPEPKAAAHRLEPSARADVKRAMEAIGRWEHHYGSARGITELARWVEGQKKEREAVPAR